LADDAQKSLASAGVFLSPVTCSPGLCITCVRAGLRGKRDRAGVACMPGTSSWRGAGGASNRPQRGCPHDHALWRSSCTHGWPSAPATPTGEDQAPALPDGAPPASHARSAWRARECSGSLGWRARRWWSSRPRSAACPSSASWQARPWRQRVRACRRRGQVTFGKMKRGSVHPQHRLFLSTCFFYSSLTTAQRVSPCVVPRDKAAGDPETAWSGRRLPAGASLYVACAQTAERDAPRHRARGSGPTVKMDQAGQYHTGIAKGTHHKGPRQAGNKSLIGFRAGHGLAQSLLLSVTQARAPCFARAREEIGTRAEVPRSRPTCRQKPKAVPNAEARVRRARVGKLAC